MGITRTGLPKLVAAVATATVAAALLGAAAPAQAGSSPATNSLHLQKRAPRVVRQTAAPMATTTTTTDPVYRLAGQDRIGTSIAVSQEMWGDVGSGEDADAVVLARSDLFPDALAGVPLASSVQGPLLLTPPTELDPRTKAEIERVLAPGKTVYVLGGEGALSASVANDLIAAGYKVTRLAGDDRFGTAAAIANEIATNYGPASLAILATGMNFPDALAAGPAAGSFEGGVVLLTDDGTMPAATKAFLDAHQDIAVYSVGGPAASADPDAPNISGKDRFETATKIADFFWNQSGVPPKEFGLATGLNFPDALSGGAFCALLTEPMLLTAEASLTPVTQTYLSNNKSTIGDGFVFGGSGVVSDNTLDEASAAIT